VHPAFTIRLDPGTTKSGEGRVFPFDVMPALGRLILRQGEVNAEFQRAGRIVPWVFLQPDGRRVGQFHKQWRRACEAAGVVRMVHDLRRSAVRRLLRAGVNEKVAMTLCGFKTRAASTVTTSSSRPICAMRSSVSCASSCHKLCHIDVHLAERGRVGCCRTSAERCPSG
jgi:SH3-like domain-containing protein